MANPFSLAALKTEIQTDPASLGYGAVVHADDCARVATKINTIGAGGAFAVLLPSITALAFQTCLDATEFTSLTALNLSQLGMLLSGGSGKLATGVVTIRRGIFTAGTFPNTRTNLGAIIQRQGSRAEVLWGTGTVVSATQVAQAMGV